jgi:hypothetical protein
MPVVITAFEVPMVQLDGFTPPDPDGVQQSVYRAVADGVRFPVLVVAPCGTGEDADRLVAAHRTVPGAMAGSYEVHHANRSAAPAYAAESSEPPVTFINAFDVEPGAEETAFAAWRVFNDYMVSKPGYRSHTLHLRTGDAAFGMVNVVEWGSVAAWQAAHDDGFRAIAARPQPFVSHPTLCRPVGVTAGDRS